MNYKNVLNASDEDMQKNMVLLIDDEDQEFSGASSPACAATAIISAVSTTVSSVVAVSAQFQVSTACSTRCNRP